MDNPIIVAMDGLELYEALAMYKTLRDHVWGFKFNDLYFEHGLSLLARFRGANVMLDAKFHDIPNTVANATAKVAADPFTPKIVTVHASGGREMVAAANKSLPGRIAAVTVLTSLSPHDCLEVYHREPDAQVAELAIIAAACDATFMVCSPVELDLVMDIELTKIVPGIRPVWHTTPDDQARVATPAQAMEAGASFLVMGRPILKADDPVEAAQRTLEEIQAG